MRELTIRPSRAITAAFRRIQRQDAGMSTAEYAVGTVAVAGLGGILFKLLTSDSVRELIWSLIQNALSAFLGN